MSARAALADTLHQQGKNKCAATSFAEAEAIQAERQPHYPLLYSLQGFQHCELLLAETEKAAWAGETTTELRQRLQEVTTRANKMFEWRTPSDPLLDIAIDHLALGRCTLYATRLYGTPLGNAAAEIECAVTGLRTAGQQHHLPHGLLTRAWLRQLQNDPAGARADLAEVERIASRGGMKLHLADHYLTRARLFYGDYVALARADLQRARALIEECGYGRRLPELAAAEAMIGTA